MYYLKFMSLPVTPDVITSFKLADRGKLCFINKRADAGKPQRLPVILLPFKLNKQQINIDVSVV